MRAFLVDDSSFEVLSEEVRRSPFKKNAEKDAVIEEGLKFFKASDRLYKLATKLEKKSKQNPTVVPIAKKINRLANKFEYVEDLYDVGRKAEAKTLYKDLRAKYAEILQILQKEDVRNILKKFGALAFTMASMTIPYVAMSHFFPDLLRATKTASNLDGKDQISVYLKRAGAFTLCGLPVKAARTIFDVGTESYENQILKSVDRLLRDETVTA